MSCTAARSWAPFLQHLVPEHPHNCLRSSTSSTTNSTMSCGAAAACASPLPFSLCCCSSSSSSPTWSYSSPNEFSSPLRSPLLPLSTFPDSAEQSPPVGALRPLCSCKSDRHLCGFCLRTLASSPRGACDKRHVKRLIRDAGTPPKPVSPMKAWRNGGNSTATVTKPVMDSNIAGLARSVWGVRPDNHLCALPSKTLSCPVGSPVSSLKEQSGPMIGSVKCHRDRPQSLNGNENSSSPFMLGSSPLKRKRPPKLNIPESPNSVTPAKTQEPIKEYSVEGLQYAVACKKGRRREVMEDAHRAITDFHGHAKQAFFGVFDGHGGCSAVDFVAENLPQEIVNAIDSSGNREDCLEEAVTAAFLSTDSGFLRKNVDSGATCAAALVRNGCLVVANAGDCRIVMSRGGKAEALTHDHKAGREDERQRIERLGGYVDCFNGVWRVQGVLAVSRGFGDRHLKDFISAKPEVNKFLITSDCDFLILASDGLWDKVGNQEAVDCARSVLEESQRIKVKATAVEFDSHELPFCSGNEAEFSPTLGTVSACKKLVEMAAKRGSVDDISVVIVDPKYFC